MIFIVKVAHSECFTRVHILLIFQHQAGQQVHILLNVLPSGQPKQHVLVKIQYLAGPKFTF